LEAPKTFSVVS